MRVSLVAWVKAHKGHNQLVIRAYLAFCQALLSLMVNLDGEGAHFAPMWGVMICQLGSSATLFSQWRTAAPQMFLARAFCNILLAVLCGYWTACGRVWWWEQCNTAGLHDERSLFRALAAAASVRFVLIATSLTLQFWFPQRGITAHHGNEQLWYRAWLKLAGLAIQLPRGVLKLTVLAGTAFERPLSESIVNFSRCAVIVVQAWSLWEQWRTSGCAARDAEAEAEEVEDDSTSLPYGPLEETDSKSCSSSCGGAH